MANYSSDVTSWIITNQGKANIFKQGSGAKLALQGFLLFKDINGWLESKCTVDNDYDFSFLKTVSFDTFKDNLNVIFKNIQYDFDSGNFTPSNQTSYDNAFNDIESNLFKFNIGYETNDDDSTVSYKAKIDKKQINVTGLNADSHFDGIILVAKAYKNEQQDSGLEIIEDQKPVLFAVSFFCGSKIPILLNQNGKLSFEIKLSIKVINDDQVIEISSTVPNEYNENGWVQSIHIVNDASSNSNLEEETLSTTNNLYLSNISSAANKSYDSFSKLNIMSIATEKISDSTPQLMFSLADGESKSWNGSRLAFNYASGTKAPLFRIYDINNNDNRLNLELFGENNFYDVSETVYGNSFIYSRENELPESAFDNTFLNSDENVLQSNAMNNISFINSNNNTIHSGVSSVLGQYPGTNNVAFFETDNADITPSYTTIYTSAYLNNDGIKGEGSIQWTPHTYGGHLSQHFLLDSDYNILSGHNEPEFHGTYISSPSAKHTFNQYSRQDLEIGNVYGYTRGNSGNFIGIGRGLIYVKGQDDKILLGNFNMNDTDPDNVLIVGDGFISPDYVSEISTNFSGDREAFYSSFSGRGDLASGNYYRHNLMTVNRKGWIGISNYANPGNSARYGFSGISAFVNGAFYNIPFSSVYARLNPNDTLSEYQSIIDNYTEKVQTIVNASTSDTKNIVMTTFTSLDINEYYKDEMTAFANNSIVNVTYQPTNDSLASAAEITYSATFQGNVKSAFSNEIKQYDAAQYIYVKDVNNEITGFFKIS